MCTSASVGHFGEREPRGCGAGGERDGLLHLDLADAAVFAAEPALDGERLR